VSPEALDFAPETGHITTGNNGESAQRFDWEVFNNMLRFTFALLAGCLFLAASVIGAESPASQAPEREEKEAKKEQERKAKADKDRKALNDYERQAMEELAKKDQRTIEREAKRGEEKKAKEDKERKAAAEKEKKAAQEKEEKAKQDQEQKAKLEEEKKAKEEKEKKAAEEKEKKAKQEQEKKAVEEKEKKAKQDQEKAAKEEKEKKAAEEKEKKAKQDQEKAAKEEKGSKAAEEKEKKTRQDEEKKATVKKKGREPEQGGTTQGEPPAVEPATGKPAEEQGEAKPPVDEATIRFAIRRLSMSGWREGQAQLLEAGRAAVPFLIDAMGSEGETAAPAAYNLGGHTKADTGRASRQRPLSEVCAEVLTDIIRTRSNYKGELPALDQKAWRDWWAANSAGITFAK